MRHVEQVGGDHYGDPEFMHWDWVTELRLPYLPATATKYLPRWRQKNGREDLLKAVSYLEKIRKEGLWNIGPMPFALGLGDNLIRGMTVRLQETGGFGDEERDLMYRIASMKTDANVTSVIVSMRDWIERVAPEGDSEQIAMRNHLNG